MRWIFLLLLMGNLLLFVLIYQAEDGRMSGSGGHTPVGQLDVMPISKYEQLEKGFLTDEPDEPQVAQGSDDRVCSSLGPLPTRDRAQMLSAELATLGVASRLRSESVKSIRDYWVIQTPEVTEEHQAEDISRLRRSGITDVSPIRDGQYRGGISLGIYRQRTNAIKRRQQVDRFGLTAEIIERGEEKPVFWVDTGENLDNALTAEERESLKQRFIPITIEGTDCR